MTAITILSSQLPASLEGDFRLAKELIRARHSDATRRAYRSDAVDFKTWTDKHGIQALPATPEVVVLYLSAKMAEGKKASTIARKVAAIRHIHREAGFPSPTDAEVVTAAMAGIRRTGGTAPRQVAPATSDKVASMLEGCDGLSGKRDRALLALGFGGALRRSELVALDVEDIEATDEGLRVHLRRSKTDQDGGGQVVPVLNGSRLSVKQALADWLEASGIKSGPIFRSIDKVGRVSADRLTDRSVAEVIKRRAAAAGMDATQFSGHSLRAGFLTTAAASGASLFKMMEVSRHRKVDTVRGYVRMADQFKNHAGAAFM